MTEELKLESKLVCSFCNRGRKEVPYIVEGKNARICSECIDRGLKAVTAKKQKDSGNAITIPNPREIHAFLDEYVIGQDEAKKTLAVAVFDHYLRLLDAESDFKDDVQIEKTNILMVGPTGSGKTYLIKTLARLLGVPFAIGDATRLTEAGFVGDDVEDLLVPLLQECGGDPDKASRGIVFIDEIDKIASAHTTETMVRDVRGRGVQQALLKLLEGSDVMVPAPGHRKMGGGEKVKIDTTNILFIVSGAFPALPKIISDRVNKKAGISIADIGNTSTHTKDESDLLMLTETEDLKNFGFIPEFLGRIPVVVALRELTETQMVEVLTKPKNALTKQYQRKIAIGCGGVDLIFEDGAVLAIAQKALKMKRGARGLRSIVDPLIRPIMYDLPSEKGQWASVVITADVVKGTGKPIKNPVVVAATA